MAKPAPLDLSHHFSSMAKRRTESSVAKFAAAILTAQHNLGPGFPFAGNFPTDTLEGAIAEPQRFPLLRLTPISLPNTDQARFTIPKVSLDSQSGDPASEIDLATALQYQSSTGYPSLASFIQDWAINFQNQGRIPYNGPETLITGGAQDGLAKCLLTFADVGESILVEEYVYFSARDQILPFGVKPIPVGLDEQGMSARNLKHILENWDEKKRGKKPHLMYTVTIGQNPTGGVMPISRKREIYELCHQHDILILEDDPYWSLQYTLPEKEAADTQAFLGSLTPSYVTIDHDGRVLGLQTFTKIFAPGCRVGWIIAQPAFIEKLTFVTDGTTSNPSGFAEAVLSQIIVRNWGTDGLIRWIQGLRLNYKSRRDVFCEILFEGRDLSVSTGATDATENYSDAPDIRMYDFRVPPGGMYVWVNLHLENHPLSQPAQPGKQQLDHEDIVLRLWNHLVSPPYSVLTLPGSVFAATPGITSAANHLRLTFAAASATDLAKAAKLFVEGVKTFWEGEGWDLPSEKEIMEAGEGQKGTVKVNKDDCQLAKLVEHHVHRSRAGQDLGLAFGRG
ncbi:PLP-dependent transferase [Thozetella sp. PMI_491]|nr:PLP-dependent transferase [Thozetella sp. PMI_491]